MFSDQPTKDSDELMFSDRPIKNSDEDLFDRKEFAHRITEIVVNRASKESVVIGLHAPWGEGKSSVLSMVKQFLGEHLRKSGRTLLNGNIVLLEFNPWRYADEESLLTSYFSSLAESVEGRITTRGEDLSKLVKKYSWASAPLDSVKISAFGLIDLSLDSEKLLEKIADAKSKVSVEMLKARIEQILEQSENRIVVIMDDIDRLDKDEIQAVFRLIKLTANFSNVCYILAFDPQKVSEALQEKYGGLNSARSFLDKIVQLSLPLPPLTTDQLIHVTYKQINSLLSKNSITLNQERDRDCSYFFRTAFGKYLSSPRQIKKYLNNLWFYLSGMKEEVDVLDLQSIEAIHTFLPELYELIRANRGVFLVEPDNPFLRDKEEAKLLERLKIEVEKFPDSEKENIKTIIGEIFPRTTAAFKNEHYGTSWYEEWNKDKRIASPSYFQRYFRFGIADADISDVKVYEFLGSVADSSDESNKEEVRKFSSNNREEVFLDKISLFLNNLDEATLKQLARAIALSGEIFPLGSGDSLAFSLTSGSYAVRLLRSIVEKLDDERERQSLAVEIVTIAEPLDFAYEFASLAKYIGVERGKRIDDADLSKLAKVVFQIFGKRAETVGQSSDLDQLFPHRSERLYRAWMFTSRETVLAYLRERIEKNPSFAVDFITSKYKQSWDVASIAQVWGFDFVVNAIEKTRTDLVLPALEESPEKRRYLVENENEYLSYYVAIAKRVKATDS